MLVFMLFLIIKSTPNIKFVGSKYVFRGWNYVTVKVCLALGKIPFYINVTSLCCLDIGCDVIFVDCT